METTKISTSHKLGISPCKGKEADCSHLIHVLKSAWANITLPYIRCLLYLISNHNISSEERVWALRDEAVAGHDRQAPPGRRRLAQAQAGRLIESTSEDSARSFVGRYTQYLL